MKNSNKFLLFIGMVSFALFACEEESELISNNDPIIIEEEILSAEGHIIAYDPQTIYGHRRIGYVIISTDLNDTLITYNLSDSLYTMPASVICNSDTLYKIPGSYFQNYENTAYFHDSISEKLNIKVTYTKALENEIVIFSHVYHINGNDFYRNWIRNQVIIKTATK